MPTIVYPPTIDFEWLYQRPQQILKAMAALGYKVVFYNHDYYFKQSESIAEVYPNFFLCKPEVDLERVNIHEPVVLWISYPPHIRCIGKYKEKITIFDAIDEPSGEFVSWAKDLDRVTKKADIVFTTAKKLYEYHTQKHGNVHMCPNGADYEHFNKAQEMFYPRPKDLPKNDRPIIGYYGAVAPWLDWELIQYISSENKELNFVIIGPLYGRIKNIANANNIYYLGRKNYSELPQYLQWFDVCIIPFRVTQMIESCNPIKMYEYLSSGKPVVATNMPEVAVVEEVYIGRDKEEFNRKIQKALIEKGDINKIQARIEFAKNNSWADRAAIVGNIIDKTIKKKLRM